MRMVVFTALAVLGTVTLIVGFLYGIVGDAAAQRVASLLTGAGWVLLGGAAILVGQAAVREGRAWLRDYRLKDRSGQIAALGGVGFSVLVIVIYLLNHGSH